MAKEVLQSKSRNAVKKKSMLFGRYYGTGKDDGTPFARKFRDSKDV